MKKLLTGLLMLSSITAMAQKECTLQLKLRSYAKKIPPKLVVEKALEVTASTNIKIVKENSDYSMEIYTTEGTDHHNARHSNILIWTELWPTVQIQRRSAVKDEFYAHFRTRQVRKGKKKALALITKALKSQLKSCAHVDSIVRGTGNGTLDPADGDTFTTSTGAEFTRVGTYWQDPSGLQWGEILTGKYKNVGLDSPAVKACEDLGARLPTIEEYDNLMTYFQQKTGRSGHRLSEKGKYEFNALFPWSFGMYTTATRNEQGVGYDFHHTAGSGSQALAHWELNVRCVK